MKPEPPSLRITIDQTDVRLYCHARVARSPSGEVLQVIGKLLHGKSVVIGANRLVLVGLRIPVPPETDHLDAHVSSASNSRSVEAGRLAPNCDTSPHQRLLLLNRQIGAEMNSARIDFHRDCSCSPSE